MQDNNYRNRTDTPMALAAIAQPLVDNMHAEIRVLYSLLKSEVRAGNKIQVQNLEELITAYIEEGS